MNKVMRLAPFLVVSLIAVPTALAQDAHYTRAEATSGVAVQLNSHASANKDCTPATAPVVKVLTPPRWGTLTVRKGVMSTDQVAGCGTIKLPAEAVFYQSRAGFQGQDNLTYEVKSSNGKLDTYHIIVEVKAKAEPPPAPKQSGSPT